MTGQVIFQNKKKAQEAKESSWQPSESAIVSGRLSNLAHLQRMAGNLAVGQSLKKGLFGSSISNQAEARFEQEANLNADALSRSQTRNGEGSTRVSDQPPGEPPNRPLGGRSLGSSLLEVFEPFLGRKLSHVHLHTDADAARMAEDLDVKAVTIGSDIIFGPGQYAPETPGGQNLLAHELTHVVQQSGGSQPTGQVQASSAPTAPMFQRKPGKKTVKPAEKKPDQKTEESSGGEKATDYQSITMQYNGTELIVHGDDKDVFRFSASSGRPIQVTEEDAALCGADVRTATYMNDKRFVGIKEKGPIPEGHYTFSPPSIERFTFGEQLRLLKGGIFGQEHVEVAGRGMHPGDWGAGRVHLNPVVSTLRQGPSGDVKKRNGFFLHGGLLRGSSGCIDIDSDFDKLAEFLEGFKRPISVTVVYESEPTTVRFFTGLGGALAYKGGFHLQHGPSLQLGTEFTPSTTRFLASPGYDAILQWAGGSLSAGIHLDIPMNDKETFVRAGLRSEADFRILGALYGRLTAGATLGLTGSEKGTGVGFEAGAGLRYDLNRRVQLEALYNVLRPFSEDERIHQALVGIGFRFE
jgi:opacity protein-like surface antigen